MDASLTMVELVIRMALGCSVLADLICDAQVPLMTLLCITLVHLDRGWPWTLRLVRHMDLSFADLDRSRCSLAPTTCITWLFVVTCDLREPL